MRKSIVAVASSLMVGACSVVGIQGVEEPAYQVIDSVKAVEIRRYGPRVVAEVTLVGDPDQVRSSGFRKIAAYIFGSNQIGAKVAMTAPVDQRPATDRLIDMTAPVAQDRIDGAWRIRFYMPTAYAIDDLPTPTDPEVVLTVVPAETVAALRFTGARDAVTVTARQSELLAILTDSRWRPAGAPVAWFYDPPWTIPWFRRNEVAITVQPPT
jgi:hypothetical protein